MVDRVESNGGSTPSGDKPNDRFSFDDGVLEKKSESGGDDHPKITFTFPVSHGTIIKALASHQRVPEGEYNFVLFVYAGVDGGTHVRIADGDLDPCVAPAEKIIAALRNVANVLEQGLPS